ncbi:chemotaxis protein CheW [Acetobacter oeni]|uniref:Chemotaxis protein CheW n=1 Tax=Acetobacter oeni TaxID=304077 RepID=A0A511XLU1_9PROT|nr:chemotaxis protein CheW [Acetobacter oeni]MBB3882971.1 purine-binding chemotaxis protein CheW [Acetobacter oeni]NHO19049.1 chemotaxis protein CheW [Acetobacter oeni]GBR09231.1 chemotaxis signal transduction protein CheW [Acetobacter oeni LMG 21952]GEN63910.1 chemotaxis protein CheW [Acetobacter oeni]
MNIGREYTGSEKTGKVISFAVGDQEYCVDILSVREIRGWTEATPLPGTPRWVRGVINLRGIILPVIDMRVMLRIGSERPISREVVMVVEIGEKISGLLVDKVSDIIDVEPTMVQEVPSSISGDTSEIISGLIALDGRMIGILNLDIVAEQIMETAV